MHDSTLNNPGTAFANIQFLISVPTFIQAPHDQGTEVAFAGRSNAGKSSALNSLCQRKALARTSKTPGRTQHLVFFSMNETQRLVDLPGYGYAKVPQAVRKLWAQQMHLYLTQRQSLKGVVLLMDIRHPLKPFDQQMLDWCDHANMPVLVLLTKADKLKKGSQQLSLRNVTKHLHRQQHVNIQLFSSTAKLGVKSAQQHILQWLNES